MLSKLHAHAFATAAISFPRPLPLQVAQGEQGPENHLLLVEAPQKPLA